MEMGVYPNPVTDMLHLKLPTGAPAEVSVYDAVGQLVIQAGGVQQLNVAGLAAGQYGLVVVDPQGRRMHARFVKQ